MDEKDIDLVDAGNYSKVIDADLAKAKLSLQGIHSEIFDAIHANMNWLHTAAIGGIKLKVRRSDLALARDVLGGSFELTSEDLDGMDEIKAGETFCHGCHSKAIRKRPIRYLDSPVFLVNLLKRWFGAKVYFRCEACGNSWRR